MKKIKLKNQEKRNAGGITLIALVITIVVLLILAGISITMLAGDNSILKQASNAKEKTREKEIQEQVTLSASAALIDSLGGTIKQDQLQEELDKYFGAGNASIEYDEATKMYTVTVEDYEVKVSNTGTVGEIAKSNISIKLTLSSSNTTLDANSLPNVSEVTSENVPIPTGFYYVGGTKNTGVVISDVSGDDLDNTAQGNQFVWVPVEQNQKLMLDVITLEDIAGIKLIGPDGTETELTASGKTFSQEITMTKNGVYTVEVTTASTTRTIEKRITSLYAQDSEILVLYVTNNYKNNAERYATINQLLEAKSTDEKQYNDINALLTDSGVSSIGEYMFWNDVFIDEAENEFKKLVRSEIVLGFIDNNQNQESVNKYGGFYIARFEAGDGTTTSARTGLTSDTDTLVSKKGAYVYNDIACEDSTKESDAKRLASGMYNSDSVGVTSQLITGAGWDRTLNWIIETGGKSENEVIIDSSSWGNYSTSTGNAAINAGISNMNYTTGRSEYWKANNIYDLAGNTYEWTQEKYSTSCISRGGHFNCNGSDYPAGCRDTSDPGSDLHYSLHAQLYIK